MADSPRKKAVTILMNIEKNAAYINIEMNKLRASNLYSDIDVRFIGELVNGVIKHKITLDYVISKHSKTKIKKIAPYILNVLRIGIYQLIYMDKVPDSAAVNETVNLVKKSSSNRLTPYVNAVMRAVSDEDVRNIQGDTIYKLSTKYSFEEWMVRRWVDRYGVEFAENLLESFNEKSPVFIRRTCRFSKKDFENAINSDGLEATLVHINGFDDFNYCYKLKSAKEITSLASFAQGLFYIQDPAAALTAFLLKPSPGETVLDMCAAPGGKSLFAADLMGNKGNVISCDIYDHKIKLINENKAKYNAQIINAQINDASVYNPAFKEIADKVLCDVPCSGLGIIRKKPDIKYSRKPEDIQSLADLSTQILDNAAKYLKPGGILVFSTCTIEPEENEMVVEAFLNKNRQFSPCLFGGSGEYYKTFYPNIDGTDGFFVCSLKKNGATI